MDAMQKIGFRAGSKPGWINRAMIAWAAAMLVCLGPGSVVLAADEDGSTPARAPYTVNPGDVLSISVWQEDELSRAVLVRPDGVFSFPLVGDIQAEGRTVEAIRDTLTERLDRYVPDPVITISANEIRGNKIYVIGQVQRPGEFLVNPNVDVVQALSMAGGMTPFASENNIRILRREGNRQIAITFRYGDISRGRNLEQNIMLRAGDTVVVP